MTGRGLLRAFTSARTTVVLLALLALLLLLNVVLPQRASLGEEAFARLVERSAGARWLLVDLGLGRMSTSPVFLVVLALFFANLALVLLARIGPTWRRVALRPRSEEGLKAWARLEESLTAPLPADWRAPDVARTLRGFGFQVRRAGERTFWGVKHRTAPLGFLLFHLSFFLLCAGGMLIYYTRFVGTVVLSEGQAFEGRFGDVERRPPLGDAPTLAFVLEQVQPRFERGDPVHLGAVFRFQQAGSSVERSARVNHPARWGSASLLVNEAGLAAVLWLQDARGYTLDRIVVPVRASEPTAVPLAGDRLVALVRPLPRGASFPQRDELSQTGLPLVVTRDSIVIFDGTLRRGEGADLGPERLVLEELRYWAGVRVVAERGGALLILGFAAGVAGLIWRLLWYRREVVVDWDAQRFRVVGRSEYFSARFEHELHAVFETLGGGSPPPARD